MTVVYCNPDTSLEERSTILCIWVQVLTPEHTNRATFSKVIGHEDRAQVSLSVTLGGLQLALRMM